MPLDCTPQSPALQSCVQHLQLKHCVLYSSALTSSTSLQARSVMERCAAVHAPCCVVGHVVQEEVRDLLWVSSSGPRPVVTIRELPTGVSLAGACEHQVTSRQEMSHVLMQGTLMRAVAATNMNNR